jgi:hypothetical protein
MRKRIFISIILLMSVLLAAVEAPPHRGDFRQAREYHRGDQPESSCDGRY